MNEFSLCTVGAGLYGWAVFTGCEGEDPRFAAFFMGVETAEAAIAMVDGDGCKRFSDAQIVPAVVLEGCGVVASDDMEIDTHEKLRRAIEGAWMDGDRLVPVCLSPQPCECEKCEGGEVR